VFVDSVQGLLKALLSCLINLSNGGLERGDRCAEIFRLICQKTVQMFSFS